ncbi:MAG: pyridoxamine 5'-phosphate oxidase family protein [Acidimicrobiia bacterium]
MRLSELARSILEDKAFVHLALLDGKGRPHVTPVWVGVDADGRPWINTIVGRLKERQLPLGAPVSLSATAPDNGYLWVSVRGHVVERRADGADGDIDQLAEKYRGAGAKAKTLPGEQRITIVIEPEAEFGGPTR